jgi:hypothetical protein
MRLNSTGLGIGTSSPAAKLHIVSSGQQVAAEPSLGSGDSSVMIGRGLTLSGTAATVGTKSFVNCAFEGSNDNAYSAFGYVTTAVGTRAQIATAFYIETKSAGSSAPTERARFNSTGALVFAGGTTTADGIGITFPASQSASSNANTLDDYEEGTWTPALGGFSSITYSAQTGTYTKIGNVVNVVCKMVVTGGTRTSADLQVFSLPFTSASQENSGGSWGYGYGVVASTVGLPQLRINASATTVSLLNTAGVVLAGTDLNTATPTINFSATYTV